MLLAFSPAASAETLKRAEAAMWDNIWTHFYCQKTHLVYDYVNSWEKGSEFKYFPTPAEIRKVIPNPMGYGTGMENACINADVMMTAILAKYAITKDDSLATRAADIFEGLWSCVMEHPNPGFALRGKAPADGESFYPVSSRDQVTQAVNAAWNYARSGLAREGDFERAKRLLCAIADHQMRTVKKENGYNFLDAYGKLSGLPRAAILSKMWEVDPHEAARLPMIYIAAYDISKDEKYLAEYRKYARPAMEQSANFSSGTAPWAHYQMHLSLALISKIAPEGETRSAARQIMAKSRSLAEKNLKSRSERWFALPDSVKHMAAPDWRIMESPEGAEIKKEWNSVWFGGEAPAYAALCIMTESSAISPQSRACIEELISRTDYSKLASQAVIYHLAVYWMLQSF